MMTFIAFLFGLWIVCCVGQLLLNVFATCIVTLLDWGNAMRGNKYPRIK